MDCIAWALASHPQSPAGLPLNRFDIGLSISLGGLKTPVLLFLSKARGCTIQYPVAYIPKFQKYGFAVRRDYLILFRFQ
jgi:hypothetical protein